MYNYGPSLSMRFLGFPQLVQNTMLWIKFMISESLSTYAKRLFVLRKLFAIYWNNPFSCLVLSAAKLMQSETYVSVYIHTHIDTVIFCGMYQIVTKWTTPLRIKSVMAFKKMPGGES